MTGVYRLAVLTLMLFIAHDDDASLLDQKLEHTRIDGDLLLWLYLSVGKTRQAFEDKIRKSLSSNQMNVAFAEMEMLWSYHEDVRMTRIINQLPAPVYFWSADSSIENSELYQARTIDCFLVVFRDEVTLLRV